MVGVNQSNQSSSELHNSWVNPGIQNMVNKALYLVNSTMQFKTDLCAFDCNQAFYSRAPLKINKNYDSVILFENKSSNIIFHKFLVLHIKVLYLMFNKVSEHNFKE